MANHGLTPEQFETLFGDVIRREIEMLADERKAGSDQVPDDSTVDLDAVSGSTSPPVAATGSGWEPKPVDADHHQPSAVPPAASGTELAPVHDHVDPFVAQPVESAAIGSELESVPDVDLVESKSEQLVGPVLEEDAKGSAGWLSGVLVVLAIVAGIGVIGFFAFQRQAGTINTEVLSGAEAAVDQADGVEDGDTADEPTEDGEVEAVVDGEDLETTGPEVAAAEAEEPPTDNAAPATDADDQETIEDDTNEDPATSEVQAPPVEPADPEQVTPETTTAPTTSQVEPQTTTPASPAAPAGSLVGTLAGSSLCQDPAGDVLVVVEPPGTSIAAPDAVDLVSVELTVSSTEVVVRWQTAAEIPADFGQLGASPVEVGSFSVTLWSDAPGVVSPDEPIRRVNLIVDIDFGDVTGLVTGSGPSLRNNSRAGAVAFDGDSIVGTFAVSDLGQLPAEFNWTGAVRVGLVAAASPEGVESFATASDSACAPLEVSGQPFPG